MTDPRTETWTVHGMTCGGCSGSVERVLTGVPGLQQVQASHETGKVVLTLDGPVDPDEVQRRIEGAGFDVVARS